MIHSSALFALVLMLLGSGPPSVAQSEEKGSEQCPPLGGELDAPIRIDVYSDFECPACRELYLETMRPVLKDYCAGNKVCVVYHEFPLPMHKHARKAARYSVAAQRLGRKQWLAVVDSLYADQPVWSKDGSIEKSVARAMSPEDFGKIMKIVQDPAINQAIDRDVAAGQKREVKSTPTLFVAAIGREQKVVGGIPYPVLKAFFDRIVK